MDSPVRATALATFPFTEDRRREVAVMLTTSGNVFCAAKGAPEIILGMSRLTPEERIAWLSKTRNFATTGHKVIACGERSFPADLWTGGEPDRDYAFLG